MKTLIIQLNYGIDIQFVQKVKTEAWTPPEFDPMQDGAAHLLDPKTAKIVGAKPEVSVADNLLSSLK